MMDIGILFNKLIDEYHKSIKEAKADVAGECIPGLTVIQYFYLQEIYREKKTTLTDLSKALEVSKPTANAVVKKLLDDGIIRRIQSEDDQRVYYLSLTKKGTQVFLAEKRLHLRCGPCAWRGRNGQPVVPGRQATE